MTPGARNQNADFTVREVGEDGSEIGKDGHSSGDEGGREDQQTLMNRLSAIDLSISPFAFKLIDDVKP